MNPAKMRSAVCAFVAGIVFHADLGAQQENPERFPFGRGTQIIQEIARMDSHYRELLVRAGDLSAMRGSGYMPYLRQRDFYRARSLADGSMPDRWDAFLRLMADRGRAGGNALVADWTSLGPNTIDSLGGRMTCHVFNRRNPSVIFAGSAGGGLWKSSDGGKSWFVVADNLPVLQISAIDMDPADTSHLLMGTGFYYLPVFPTYAGIGLLESRDGGSTWRPNSFAYPPSAGVSVTDIVWDETNPQRVYLGASNGIWISRDGGASWSSRLPDVSIVEMEINRTRPEILYAAARNIGIYKSMDSGLTWTLLPPSAGLPDSSQVQRISLAICDASPNILLASISDRATSGLLALLRTGDGGATWTSIQPRDDYLCGPSTLSPTYCQGWFVNQVAIHPRDTNTMFVGGVQFHRTSDGGASWQWLDYYATGLRPNRDTGLVYVDQMDIAFHPLDPDTVLLFNDGGVFRSTDGGRFWNKGNEGLGTAMIYRIAGHPLDTALLIGGFQDHGLQYLDNTAGNLVWKRWDNSDGLSVNFDPENKRIAYGDWPNGVHRKTNDMRAGVRATFGINSGIIGPTTSGALAVTTHHPTEPGVLITADDNRIYRTANGGVSWSPVAEIPDVRAVDISPVDPNTMYAASYSSTALAWAFHNSTDGGRTWRTTASGPGWRVTDLCADPNRLGVVYATRNSSVTGNPHVYRSTDHGESWARASDGLPDVATSAVTVNPFDSDVVYVGTDLGVFVSTDAGATWSDYNRTIAPYYVSDMHFHRGDTTLRIATFGRGVWKTRAYPPSLLGTGVSGLRVAVTSMAVSPNPVAGEANITFRLHRADRVEVIIVDYLGSVAARVCDGVFEGGEHTIRWGALDGARLPAGRYFVQLVSGGRRLVHPIVWGAR